MVERRIANLEQAERSVPVMFVGGPVRQHETLRGLDVRACTRFRPARIAVLNGRYKCRMLVLSLGYLCFGKGRGRR